jgi:hypothetical protein
VARGRHVTLTKEGPDDEAIEVYGRADHWDLAEQEAGRSTADGLPQARDQQAQAFYHWKAKFGGMEVSDGLKE